MSKKIGIPLILVGAVSVSVLLYYQNCANSVQTAPDVAIVGALSNAGDTNHPASQTLTPPMQHTLVYNKVYVASLLRDIFSRTQDSTTGLSNDAGLEALIFKWIQSRPGQFGGACTTYDTYSNRDCGGSTSSATLPPTADDNTVRESFRLQFCENVLGTNDFVTAVLTKVGITSSTLPTPDNNSITEVYGLFYRADPPSASTLQALMQLDASMVASSQSTTDQWRGIILAICESPGWQLM